MNWSMETSLSPDQATPSQPREQLRNNSGVFGDGWTSELNDLGPLGAMNGFGPGHQIPGAQSYVLETITTYDDQYGHFLGKSITYSVVAPPGTGIDFLDPTTPYSNYTKTNANGTVETFDGKSGLLIGISDGQGDAITINRNASGVITSIATASGTPPPLRSTPWATSPARPTAAVIRSHIPTIRRAPIC